MVWSRRSAALAVIGFASAAASAADAIVLTPRIFPVGRWAEGLAVTPGAIWVAESGQRSIAELDPDSGAVRRRVKVGRLPVGMATTPQGEIATLVQTDRLVWLQEPDKQDGRALPGLEGCPNGIASGAALWVLTLPGCTSETSRVLRLGPGKGDVAGSRVLPQWAEALTVDANAVWVAHARSPALSIVDPKTLAARSVDVAGGSLWAIVAAGGRIFAGGRRGSDNDRGVVAMIESPSGEVRRVQDVNQRIAVIAADDRNVVAIGEKGTIWVFSADTLDVGRMIGLGSGSYQPRAAVIRDDKLYIANQQQDGENGAVLVVTGWRQ